MAGFQSIAPMMLNAGVNLATSRSITGQQVPGRREVGEIVEDSDRERRATLLEREQRQARRQDDLRRRQASGRARAAAQGVSGGASARAVQEGLAARSERDEGFDDARTDLRLEDIGVRRQRSLLDVAEQRRRASLGLIRQLGRRFL